MTPTSMKIGPSAMLTKKQRRILIALLDGKATRDTLMNRVGSYVAHPAIRGLEKAGFVERHEATEEIPLPHWSLSEVGTAVAKAEILRTGGLS